MRQKTGNLLKFACANIPILKQLYVLEVIDKFETNQWQGYDKTDRWLGSQK